MLVLLENAGVRKTINKKRERKEQRRGERREGEGIVKEKGVAGKTLVF